MGTIFLVYENLDLDDEGGRGGGGVSLHSTDSIYIFCLEIPLYPVLLLDFTVSIIIIK